MARRRGIPCIMIQGWVDLRAPILLQPKTPSCDCMAPAQSHRTFFLFFFVNLTMILALTTFEIPATFFTLK